MTKAIHKDSPERTSRDTPQRETQTTFEEHPDAGSMMTAALSLDRIAAITREIENLYIEERQHVETARANGVSWQKIGDALGVTRSAAQQYYGQ